MAKITATQKLIVEDFADQKDWIGKLFGPLNDFIINVLRSVNGGIEFSSNILGLEKEFDFSFVSDAVSLPLKVTWTLLQRPKAYYLVAAYENDPTVNNSFAPITLAANYIINAKNEIEMNGIVKLTSSGISGLTTGKRYKIIMRATP